MNQFQIEDLTALVKTLSHAVRAEDPNCPPCPNFEAFAEAYEAYARMPSAVHARSAEDQMGLILAKADDSSSHLIQLSVVIILDANQAIQSYQSGEHEKSKQCVKAALSHALGLP